MTNPVNKFLVDSFFSTMSINDTNQENQLQLQNAIKNRSTARVAQLIQKMKTNDLDVKDSNGKTPLELVIKANMSTDIIRQLIEKDVDLTFLNLSQVEHLLSRLRQFQSAQIRLVRYGVMHHRLDVSQYWIYAMMDDFVELANELVDQGTDVNASIPLFGNTMLHEVVKKDFSKFKSLFYRILDKKANVNAIDYVRDTPLSIAIKFDVAGGRRFAFCLIEAGASLYCISREAVTELFITAIKNQSLDYNRNKMLFRLLEHGIDVNAKVDGSNRSVLFWAIKNNLPEIAVEFISRGANVNLASKLVDDNYDSPLHLALKTGCVPVIKKLLTVKNININICNYVQQTPLHIACITFNLPAINLLLQYGAQLGIKNAQLHTPFVAYLYTSNKEYRVQKNQMFSDLCTQNKIPAVLEYIKKHEPDQKLLTYFLQNPRLLLASENPLELALLFGDLELALAMMNIMPKEAFYTSLDQLTLKYPHQSQLIESFVFANSFMALDHLESYVDLSIKPRPDRSDFSKDLVDIFRQLNFHNPQQKYYIDPKTVFGKRDETFQTLEAALTDCLRYITDSQAYFGTPKAGTPALHTFYETIRNALYFTGKKLKDLSWEESRHLARTWILKIFEASKLCAGRLYNTIVSQHAIIVAGNKESYENYVTHVLGHLRGVALDSAISQLITNRVVDNELIRGQTVHFYNQLMHSFGEKYKIPGYKVFLTFEDPFSYLNEQQIKQAEQFFLTAYNNQEALFHWIRDDIWHDETVRSLFITYLTKTIPDSFQSSKYSAIIDTIQNWTHDTSILEIAYNILKPEHKEKIDELFGKKENDIVIVNTETPLEAIQKDKATEYLYTIYETVQDGIKTVSRIRRFIIFQSLIEQKIFYLDEKPIFQEEKKEREEKSSL